MRKLFHVLVVLLKRKLRQYYAYSFVYGAHCVILNCLKVAWFERKRVALTGFLVINEFCFTAVYWIIFVCEMQGDESYEVINQLFVMYHFWGRNSEMFTRFSNIFVILKRNEDSKCLRRANIRVRTSVSYRWYTFFDGRNRSSLSLFAQGFAHGFRRILCACVMALQAAEFWSRCGDGKEGQILTDGPNEEIEENGWCQSKLLNWYLFICCDTLGHDAT